MKSVSFTLKQGLKFIVMMVLIRTIDIVNNIYVNYIFFLNYADLMK